MHCLSEHQSGGGTRAARLCSYLESLEPDTILLAEWRDNGSGRSLQIGLRTGV